MKPPPLPSHWQVIADKISGCPECIDTVLENIERWLARGHGAPERLREWQRLLLNAKKSGNGMSDLLSVLTSDDPQSARMRDFSPFAGILTPDERRETREPWTYRH
ncbi:MAG: hypothetical protein PHD76_08065 [Methylacidiphilales bacterium]|nr:hypothetical protein [Candidatus Methylacidiphilales bacterium]